MIAVYSALPYATARLHLGRLLTSQYAADVYVKFLKLIRKKQATHLTGLDCHGSAVYLDAKKHHLSANQYVRKKKKEFLHQLALVDIHPHLFLLTTSPLHKQFVKKWFEQFPHKLKTDSKGWYCSNCKRFLNDRFLRTKEGALYEKIIEANNFKETNFTELICSECTTEVESKSYTGYFIKIPTTVLQRLKITYPQFYHSYQIDTLPELKEIGRKNCPWGITIPGDDSTNFYVWIEALKAYETMRKGKHFSHYYYFYGRDNTFYHLLLMSCLKTVIEPETHFSKNYLLLDSKKMSSSVDNIVTPSELNLKAEEIRYYLAKNDTIAKDRQHSKDLILAAVKELKMILHIPRRIFSFRKISKIEQHNSEIYAIDHQKICTAYEQADYGRVIELIRDYANLLNLKLSDFFEKKQAKDPLARVLKSYYLLRRYLSPIVKYNYHF